MQRVQTRNYSSKDKWKMGTKVSKKGNIMYRIKTIMAYIDKAC